MSERKGKDGRGAGPKETGLKDVEVEEEECSEEGGLAVGRACFSLWKE